MRFRLVALYLFLVGCAVGLEVSVQSMVRLPWWAYSVLVLAVGVVIGRYVGLLAVRTRADRHWREWDHRRGV